MRSSNEFIETPLLQFKNADRKYGSSGFCVGSKIAFSAFGSRERVNGAGIEFEERPPVAGTIWGCKIELSTRDSWGSKIHGE